MTALKHASGSPNNRAACGADRQPASVHSHLVELSTFLAIARELDNEELATHGGSNSHAASVKNVINCLRCFCGFGFLMRLCELV
jgi:hypothetical protein